MSSEILQKIEELYKSNGLNDEELIHEACFHREKCWAKASVEKKDNKKNKIALPYIGDKFKGDLLCIGLNFNEYGEKDAHKNLISDARKLLTEGKIRINFNLGKKAYVGTSSYYVGTFLFHRMSVYANIILDHYKYENDEILSLDNRILYYSRDYLADIYSELIFLNAIKCSPKGEKSKPFNSMYQNCFDNILCKEIKIIKPKNILVFDKYISELIKNKFGCTNNISRQKMEYYKIAIENTLVNVYRVIHPQGFGGNSKKLITELHNLKQEVSL
ncbi:MAG: hypothetical protein LBQ76_04015 [Candidatus Fibromonas sp.]|jgi:hypothetical protein|nr:hypothetical protein [Candidatus Fibromonas sp.]